MKTLIKNFFAAGREFGLCLADAPTGSGKTYAVFEFIADLLIEGKDKRKIIFMTSLKKNLSADTLQTMLDERTQEDLAAETLKNDSDVLQDILKQKGKKNLFARKCLVLNRNADGVIEYFGNEQFIQDLPDFVKQWDEYTKLKKALENYDYLRAHGTYYAKEQMEVIRTEYEPSFRRRITNELHNQYHGKKDRVRAVKFQKNWQWVSRIYPAVYAKERQVLFMSVDKFLCPFSSIVEKPFYFMTDESYKGCIIFIDEFDASKATLLNHILSRYDNAPYNFMDFFKTAQASLALDTFPTAMTQPSEKWQKSIRNYDAPTELLRRLINSAQAIFTEYSLDHSPKLQDSDQRLKRTFLFHDCRFHYLFSEKKKQLLMEVDEEKSVNAIFFKEREQSKDEDNAHALHIVMARIKGFISYFCNVILMLAVNYRNYRNETSSDSEEYLLESAVRTMLNQFNFDRAMHERLTRFILTRGFEKSDQSLRTRLLYKDILSFYDYGFRYWMIEDSAEHDLHSKIMVTDLADTPESIMLRICRHACVFGLSATASVPSVIANYDLPYLKDALGKNYYEVPAADKQRIEDEFRRKQSGYENINIHSEFWPQKECSAETWEDILEEPALAEEVYAFIQNMQTQSGANAQTAEYINRRYWRIAKAYRAFVEKDIASMICLLTLYPKNTGSELRSDLLYKIFNYIRMVLKKNDIQAETDVLILNSTDYEEKKARMQNRLAAGEKLFVISVYATLGAGQNLQYPIPEDQKKDLIPVNDLPGRGETDFQAIYLDAPTHLSENIQVGMEESSLRKLIYETLALCENGEISLAEKNERIESAFNSFRKDRSKKDEANAAAENRAASLKECESFKNAGLIKVIQAIGRICRTNQKHKDIYIFADPAIRYLIEPEELKKRPYNHEFLSLAHTALQNRAENSGRAEVLRRNRNMKVEDRLNLLINRHLSSKWPMDLIENWRSIRKFVLTNPCTDIDPQVCFPPERRIFLDLGERADHYYFSLKGINLAEQISTEKINPNMAEVSCQDARLDELLKEEGFREYLEEQGYCTAFKPARYMICPSAYQKIYKGALGEEFGRFMFKKYLGIELQEIDDSALFEKFDFLVPNKAIGIDFKHWNESSKFPEDEFIAKTFAKAREAGLKHVLLINSLVRSEDIWQIRDLSQAFDEFARDSGERIKITIIPSLRFEGNKQGKNDDAWKRIEEVIYEAEIY